MQYDTIKIIPDLEFAAAAESREIPAWLLALVHTTLNLYRRALRYVDVMGTFLGNDQIHCHNLKSPVISLILGVTIAILFQTQREHTT